MDSRKGLQMDDQRELGNLKLEYESLKPKYALSIKQPWSWLICRGIKDVENRTWHIHMPPLLWAYPATPRRIYVHTGLSRSEMTKPILAKILKLLTGRQASEFMLAYDRLTFGAIIGEVDIIGCTVESGSPWFTGPYALMLSGGILYDKPIPCKGKLGFFDPEIPAREV